jgi:hypothetical protein
MDGEVSHLKEALALNIGYSLLGMLAGILCHIYGLLRMNLYLVPAVLLDLRE